MDLIAFATETRFPDGYLDDAAVRPAFLARGLEPVPVIWDDPTVDWGRFRAVILRSPWDYVGKAAAFLAWLDALPVPVWNPKEIVRWNLTKTYLQDLEARGVPVLPTAVLQPGEDLGALLVERAWPEVVVKPMVGAGGFHTWRVDAENLAVVTEMVTAAAVPMLVQPYLPEVRTEGEWSLLYFDGVFSHSLRKRPKDGEFRVQQIHGGTYALEEAPAAVRAVAETAIATIGTTLPYARMDLIAGARGPVLMEAELIEPELFLRLHPPAGEAFAEAVRGRVSDFTS